MWTNLIPLAGAGTRFREAGYATPKPFLPIHGKPMIQWVWENLPPADAWVFVVQEAHESLLADLLQCTAPHGEVQVHVLESLTQGAACTVLEAQDRVDPQSALLIADSDQWLDWSPSHFADYCYRSYAHGVIGIWRHTHAQYSYAEVLNDGRVVRVAEKQPISTDAVAGTFYWRTASMAFQALQEMIFRRESVLGEYYVCPAYNTLLSYGGEVLAYPIPRLWPWGTPDEYAAFLTAKQLSLDEYCGQGVECQSSAF